MYKQLWMEVEMEKQPDVMVVDCGYLDDQAARDRADKLFAFGVGKKNCSIELSNRIFVRIPPSKQQAVVEAFKLSDRRVYWGSTHCWPEMTAETKQPEVVGFV